MGKAHVRGKIPQPATNPSSGASRKIKTIAPNDKGIAVRPAGKPSPVCLTSRGHNLPIFLVRSFSAGHEHSDKRKFDGCTGGTIKGHKLHVFYALQTHPPSQSRPQFA